MPYTPFDFNKITDFIDRAASDVKKLSIRNLIDMYRDNWDWQIDEEIQRQFSPKVRKNLLHLITTEFNVLKRVTNETSLVYKNPALRRAVISTKNTEGLLIDNEDKNYEEMIAQSNIDAMSKQINKYTSFLNQVIVRPVVRDSKMEYDMHTLDSVDIICDPLDWKRIVAIKYYIGLDLPTDKSVRNDADIKKAGSEGEGTGYKLSSYNAAYLWCLEDYEETDFDDVGNAYTSSHRKGIMYKLARIDGKDVITDEGEEIKYKDETGKAILPFVLFWKNYPVSQLIDDTSGRDLVDATMRFAINLAHMQYLIKFQSYKVGQISTRDKTKLPSEISLDPGRLYVNEDSEGTGRGLEVVDFTADISSLWNTLKEGLILFLSNYGISPSNFTLSGTPSSGFALKISNQAKLEYREDQIDIYREREKELFRISRIVWNADVPSKKINEKAQFKIDFAEVNFPMSADEENKDFTFLKSNNAATDVDLIIARNPDMTRDEALKKHAENKAYNAAQNVTLAPSVSPIKTEPKLNA